MTTEDSSSDRSSPAGIDPVALRRIVLAMLGLIVAGAVVYQLLREKVGPPPPEVARDALLNQGRTIYLGRCATCHGNSGRGDGPIAGSLIGPPVGNLTDERWKHGDQPDQVLAVIGKGVPSTRMDGYGRVLDPPDLRAVAAYVYYLAKRPVPEALRQP
jgi:cytochrome c oxidase cbb3-type subunit III